MTDKNQRDPAFTQQRLQRLYPLPEQYSQRVQNTLQRLANQKEEPVKKRSLTLIAVFAILVMLATGGYALYQYGVLTFLFPDATQEKIDALTPLTQKLDIQQSASNVTLHIASAFYDGEAFALDWTIKNEQPKSPRYVSLERFEVGGQRLWGDGNDSFDSQWLPGTFSQDGSMQDGELSFLPLDQLQGDIQKVVMDINVYTPLKPLFYLKEASDDLTEEQQNAWKEEQNKVGAQKLKEGYIVMDQDMFFVAAPKDEENPSGYARVIGPIVNILSPTDYSVEPLSITFDLDINQARAQRQPLSPQASYTFDWMTTQYVKAVKTPNGLYLTLDVKPLPDQEEQFQQKCMAGEWAVSDGQGKKIDLWPLTFENLTQPFEDGTTGRRIIIALPLLEKDMPDTVSLSFYPEGEEPPLLSPVSTQ